MIFRPQGLLPARWPAPRTIAPKIESKTPQTAAPE